MDGWWSFEGEQSRSGRNQSWCEAAGRQKHGPEKCAVLLLAKRESVFCAAIMRE
jgi:hypothetical protein